MANTLYSGTQTFTNKITSFNSDFIKIDGATNISYTQVIDDNTPAAVDFAAGRVDTTTFTYDTKDNTSNGDYAVVKVTTGASWAIALSKEDKEVTSIDFADKAATTAGDYFVVYDSNGAGWAAAMDVSGSDPAPTGAIWTALAAGKKVNVDISSATNDEDIAALVKTAMEALTGWAAQFTITDPADGTLTFTAFTVGTRTDAVVKNADDSGAGSIAKTVTTQGVAIGTPTGAIWTAIPAANKGIAVITSDTTAADVAARAETAWDALTGFSSVITSTTTSAAIAMANVVRGICGAGQVKNIGDTGAGSITVAETTAGIDSDVNTSTETITLTAHGYTTGLKGQASSTGTLPTGLSASTDYYVISTGTNTIQLATSLANALAGTAINITDQGTSAATHTFTPTSIGGATYQVQVSPNDDSLTAGVWTGIANATSITVDTSVSKVAGANELLCGNKYMRFAYAITAGRMSISTYVNVTESGV